MCVLRGVLNDRRLILAIEMPLKSSMSNSDAPAIWMMRYQSDGRNFHCQDRLCFHSWRSVSWAKCFAAGVQLVFPLVLAEWTDGSPTIRVVYILSHLFTFFWNIWLLIIRIDVNVKTTKQKRNVCHTSHEKSPENFTVAFMQFVSHKYANNNSVISVMWIMPDLCIFSDNFLSSRDARTLVG